MKKQKTRLMAIIMVVALTAFIASSSAGSIANGSVVNENEKTTEWSFSVTADGHEINHFVVAWCNESAVAEVTVDGVTLDYGQSPGRWHYGTYYQGKDLMIRGIKIHPSEYIEIGDSALVVIKLNGNFESSDNVKYVIVLQSEGHVPGQVKGPVACAEEETIPEFSSIAIPIASIIGLLFFFNHRNRREGKL